MMRRNQIASRTVVATALAVVTTLVFSAVGFGTPPTDGITATCNVGGQSVVTGFKGNPLRVDFSWRNGADGLQSDVAVVDVGGKFGNVATASTPATNTDPAGGTIQWTPDSLNFSVIYKGDVYTNSVPCR